MLRFTTSLLILALFVTQIYSQPISQIVLTGTYQIDIGHNQIKQFYVNDKSSRILYKNLRNIKVNYEVKLPNYLQNEWLILKIGRIYDIASIYWDNELIGSAGSKTNGWKPENWVDFFFIIPPGRTIGTVHRIQWVIDTRQGQIGLPDNIPELYSASLFFKNEKWRFAPNISPLSRLWIESAIKGPQYSNSQSINTTFFQKGYNRKILNHSSYQAVFYPNSDIENAEIVAQKEYQDNRTAYLVNLRLKDKKTGEYYVYPDSFFFEGHSWTGDQARCYTDTYFSPIVGEFRPYGVYLPENFATCSTPLPIIYAFGGGSESHRMFVQGNLPNVYDTLIRQGNLPKFIMIAVAGSPGSAYMKNTATGIDYEASFIRELIPIAEKKLARLAGDAPIRWIMGYSLGGLAAMSIGLRYPGLFKGIISIAGVLNAPIGDKNPFTIVNQSVIKSIPSIWLGVGQNDELGLLPVVDEFHRLLIARSISHRYYIYPGGHHHAEWIQALPHIGKFLK